MIRRCFFLQYFCFGFLLCAGSTYAASVTWQGQGSNNDMNDPANWNPNTVPSAGDEAVFNSNALGINTAPTENFAPFTVSSFHFPFNASNFHFAFNNQTLTFAGNGITGNHINPTINVTNTNNASFPGDLISFIGSTGNAGSSKITIANSGTLSGNLSGTAIGAFNSNLYSSGGFTIANGGKITATNTGLDSTIGTGNNGTANTGTSQLRFDQSFTAEDNVSVSVSNSGTFSGTNTAQGDAVAIVNGSQFFSAGAFQAGSNFHCDVQNTGNDSCLGVGLSNIGQINAAQMILQSTGSVGNYCSINVLNTGINSSQTTNFPDFIGYLNDQQFYAAGLFQAGSHFNLSVSNTGTDTSNGYGGCQVAVINSNSGTSGNQILLREGCVLGDRASISAANSGTYSGTNTNGGSNVAGMNLQQIAIGESTAPGSHSFSAGNYFSLSATNSGTDSSTGTGGDAVGNVSADQIAFFTPVALGNSANVAIENSGNYSGQASSTYVNVGSTGGVQINCYSSVSVGDDFALSVSNSGTNTGSGLGGYFIGDIINGQQVRFQNTLNAGNNASFVITNNGSNSSNTANSNQVGSFMGYGKQWLLEGQYQIGNNLLLQISNTGFDDSVGAGGNLVGFLNNNTADSTASQAHFSDGGSIGDRASIILSNSGTYQGSNTTLGNLVAVLAGQQLRAAGNFSAGDDFYLSVSNSGVDDALGQNSNSIGTMGGSQAQFDGLFTVGNNASVVISNSGTNNDTTGISNNIGVINGSQLVFNGNFTAGRALNLGASNQVLASGGPNNFTGHVTGSQIIFGQSCTLQEGSTISAINSGTVENSQIVFSQGFNIASGKVDIHALNQGVVGTYGIDIQGANSGGQAHIRLSNCTLNIGTTLPSFTIAGLEGNSSSIAQSLPMLIIDTDASTLSEFSGVIQNYPAAISTLTKTGAGTQKLSGANTYTGLTTIQEGVLIVNGSLAADVLIDSQGTLKGSGTIGGTVLNTGVVSPGESIGTLTVGNYTNAIGTYAAEVNGLGQSDLINATGTALINGGSVLVSSSDGTFRFQTPYTIMTAVEGVFGAFSEATSSAFIKPTLTYDSNNVYLTIQSALLNAARGCNQIGVAAVLDNIVQPNADQSLLISAIASLPLESAQKSLESLSGFQYASDAQLTNILTERLLRRLYDPLRSLVTMSGCCNPCSAPCSEWTPWIEAGYEYVNLRGHNTRKLDCDGFQVTGGIQKTFCENLTFGVAGSYEYDVVNYTRGDADRNSVYASIYGLYRPRDFYFLFDLVYGYSYNELHRKIDAEPLQFKARSKQHYNIFSFYGEAGLDFYCGGILMQPFFGIQAGKCRRGNIHEHQSEGWGLAIAQRDWSTAISRLGLHLTAHRLYDCFDTSFDLAWDRLLSSRNNSTTGRFKDFGAKFPVCGNKLDVDSIDCALTLMTCSCGGWKEYLVLSGEWWQHAATYNVICGVEFSW